MPTYNALPSSRRDNLPQANIIADKVICLPIYPELQIEEIEFICDILKS
jgi:dTDP-4-amino-4,6-dideoxygalactose transaminase